MAKWEETQECLAGNAAEAAHIAQKEEEQRWWAARWEAAFGLPEGGWGEGGPEQLFIYPNPNPNPSPSPTQVAPSSWDRWS